MIRSTPEVKQLNKERIRREIQKSEKCTKAGISKETMLSVATCNTIFNELLEAGEIIQAEQEEIYMGRPASLFKYNPDYQHVLVMYISNEQGINMVEFAVADALGKQIRREQVHPEAITYEVIENLTADIIKKDLLIQGMTFGIPGVSRHGIIEYCDVESMIGVDLEGQLKERFKFEVEMRNDMDFLSTGVYHTVSHGGGNLATIYFPVTDTGYVGCGFVIDGKVLRGHSKFAGEISYVAKGYGIPRQQQMEMLSDRTSFRELVAKMVVTVIATIDPETVMVMGNEVDQKDLAVVRKLCEAVVSEKHIPQILIDNRVSDYFINGLIRVALDRLQFPISNN